MSSADRLRTALKQRAGSPDIDLAPKSAHEAVTRSMVEEIRRDVGELSTRVNGLIWTVVGAIVVSIVMRLLGG